MSEPWEKTAGMLTKLLPMQAESWRAQYQVVERHSCEAIADWIEAADTETGQCTFRTANGVIYERDFVPNSIRITKTGRR